MNCTINDINLTFDQNSRLRTTIGRVTGFDIKKAYVLASFLQDQKFKKYLLANITENDVLKDNNVDFKNFTENDYVKLNQNKLGALLNTYYIEHYFSVNNSKTNKGLGNLSGFTSASAKTIAKTHTANLIIDAYYEEFGKANPKKAKDIILAVNEQILTTFFERVARFAEDVSVTDGHSKEAKDYAKKYIELNQSIKELYDKNKEENNNRNFSISDKKTKIAKIEGLKKDIKQFKEGDDNYKRILQQIKSLTKEIKQLETESINPILNNIKNRLKEIAILERDKYVMAQNLVNLYCTNTDLAVNERLRNYANLVAQTRGDANGWYFQVFNTKTMTSIIKEFNNIGDIEEYIEQQDENNDDLISRYNGESVDETAKSWEDNLYKSFNQIINGRLKLELSRIPKLENRFNKNSKTQAVDTNNELGVPTYMDAQFVSVQIFTFGNFNSVRSFVDSLEEKSNNIKSLYGLGSIVNRMKRDKVFANYMYANFAKPIVDKTMLTINDVANGSFSFEYSNPNAFPITELVFRITNKIRATYNTSYNKKDIIELSNILEEFESGNNTVELKDRLYKIISNYISAFDKEVFNNYFDNNGANINQRVPNLINSLRDIINGIGYLKDEINKEELEYNKNFKNAREQYQNDYREWLKLPFMQRKETPEPQYPKYEYVDYSSKDLNSTIYKGIFNFAKEIVEFTEARVRLNTTNSEGNSASDVIKNCFVTRFFDQINAKSEEDSNAGLKNLLKFVTQGTENGQVNQYSNNPLLFGIKDENGQIVSPGMFTRVGDEFRINPNAKEILKNNLFDGVKNNKENTADSYASMTKLDFFVTQYLTFRDGVTEFTENGKQTKIGKQDNAVYAMRIGSDAPKIFFIRAPKYNYTQLELAFYNHVIGELNTFCKALNNIFVQESDGVFRTTTNIDKLIGRAFYDERTADKIKHDKGTDFTKAIVQDGRLVGNMFAFKRLFDTNGYSASNEIETMLSLYGGRNTEGLIIPDNNGRLSINPSRINNTSQNQSIIWTGEQFELNLSIEQKQILKGIVKQWMNNYVQEITNRTSEFTKVMKENGITTDRAIVHSYLLNSANMNMCYDDLFEGDYKYYTNARDFLKRTKEVQAGGDVYAGYDLLDANNDVLHDLDWYGTPEYINIKTNKTSEKGQYVVPTHKGNRIENAPMVARNGWRAITIYNTNKASDVADEMQKNLEDNFIKDGMSEEVAHKRSVLIASGYGHNAADIKGETTKINDAQSYITFEEFIRRRHADGTIDQYQDLIAQLLDPNISAEEIDLTDINTRIQVQKNFYFDIRFDANTGLYYPRQIKNAEFVLIPKLLPKDSQLRKVYDFMKKYDIGQLNTAETSKAAKRTIFTIWDQKTGEFNENFEEDFNENYVEDYFYQYLYKQQEVPEHIKDAKNKAGIQITKKIIDNVINRANKNPHLQKWASDYQNAYSINIEESFYEFLETVGWALDSETGKIVNAVYATTDSQGNELSEETIKANKETLNFNKFYQLAREEAARVGRDSNFMEYLIPNEFGDPEMPNYMSNVMSSLESIAQSIFNSSITRQTFPGWHAAQITGVGYSKKLKFDSKTGVMEVYLPRWSKLIPKGKNAEEDAKILQQIQNEGLDIHLGYRIPTEGKQSISVLRVVGFTNECLGSTIIVPDDWVTQTGSDFDVDSIYGIAYEIYQKKDKKGNITVHKIPFEEGEVNDQDLYIQYINSKLENKIKLKDVSDISGDIKNDIEDIKNELNNTELRGTLSKEFDKLDEQRNELYEKLPSWARGIIKTENEQAKKLEKKDKIVTDLRNVYGKINEKFEEQLNKRTLDDETKEDIQEYMDLQTGLIDVMNRQEGIPGFDKEEYKSKKAEAIQSIIEAAKQEWIKTLEEKAKTLGLLSFDEFIKLDHLRKLSRRARNNYILDRMIKIMNDPASHEEQYGRSKFDDITNANKLIDKLYGKEDSKTSPYNQLDQLDYFDDALGGARLKALSVNHDRFNSINNKVRAELSDEDAIDVILTVNDKSAEDSDIIYDENIIRENYDNIKELNNQQNIIDEKILENVDKKIGIDNAKTTINTLNSDNNELSEQEKEIIKKELGNKPRVLVASEATDPVFHAAKIKKLVNDELAKPAKDRKFQMMYLITKHDGIPFKELAELKIPKFIHFSITSLGGTKYEPGVMKMDDLLDRIEQFIKDKVINPNLVTIRIDPIVPGVTKEEDIRHIIERATSMGIRQFKFSIMDSYGSSENTEKDRYVVQKMKSLGYEWDKYYEIGRNGKYSFNPKLEYMNYYYQLMDNLADEFRINMWTCGEQPNFNLKRVRTNVGCINVDAMNKAMGTKDITDVKGSQRKECSCYGNKSDACSYNDACASSCMYCYARHNSDNAMKYYDKNGNLLDNDFTRTVKNNYINEKYPIVELKHEKVLKEKYGLNIPHISKENKSYMRYYFSNNVIIGDNYYNIQEIFALVDVLYEFEQNLNSDKDIANKMLYKDFISKYPNMGKQLGFIQSALDGQFGFYKEFKYKKGEVVLRKSVFKLLDNIKNINPNLLNDISISEIINENYLIEDLINEINDNVKINDSRQLELNFNEQQTTNKKQILFKANHIGWSNNNRNIVGEIVTSYGSQTTAHHLDAVKMGSVPNVNEYTFSVYKLLSSLGLDHEFAIAFIRQPAITSIVNNNNLLESVFFSSRNNPINLTLKEIANRFSNTIPINEDTYYKQKYKKHLNKYGEFDEDTIIKLKLKPRTVKKNASLHNTLAALKNNDNFINAFRKLFDIDISNMSVKEIYNIKVPLSKEQLFTRIKREAQRKGNVFENAAFDFAMALNFKQYKNTANKLEDYINVTAADKFGAEISVRKTRLIKETVAKLRGDMTLSKNGVSFIDLIYPIKNNDENQIDIERSSYKSIASVYAYATIPSIQTSSQLFIIENDNYADVVSYIEYKIKHKLNDNEYKEYKRYAMNYLYNHISKLLSPLIVNQKGQIIYNIDKIEENEIKLKTANKYWDIERSRILGYGIVTDGDFTPENLNKPTDNDIKLFNDLTPAQKVLFMQKHYPDGQGIFNYIKVTLLNPGDIKYKGLSRQYLAVDDQVDNIEDLFQLFINSFSNKNPLIKLAAIDLIKYSFIAEGFNFKSGYINKIIPNSTLYTSDKDGGMDIIKDIKSQINYFYNQLASDEFIDNFVRSHSELIKLDKFAYYESEFESLILKNRKGGGLIYINDKDLIDKLNLKNRADGYVRLSLRMTENEKTVTDISLYKVLKKADDKYFLLPLNTLDKYETHDYSYNANNNKFATLEYYKDLAQKWYTEGKFVRASKFEPIYKYTPDNQYDPKDSFMLM